MREQAIVRVTLAGGGGSLRAHREGTACQHEPQHRLDGPALRDELAGEPVEQFGMTRLIGQLAEVVCRAHEARAEDVVPKPVHHHARGERVAENVLGQLASSAGVRLIRRIAERREKLSRHGRARLQVIAAREKRRVKRRRFIRNRDDAGGHWDSGFEFAVVGEQLREPCRRFETAARRGNRSARRRLQIAGPGGGVFEQPEAGEGVEEVRLCVVAAAGGPAIDGNAGGLDQRHGNLRRRLFSSGCAHLHRRIQFARPRGRLGWFLAVVENHLRKAGGGTAVRGQLARVTHNADVGEVVARHQLDIGAAASPRVADGQRDPPQGGTVVELGRDLGEEQRVALEVLDDEADPGVVVAGDEGGDELVGDGEVGRTEGAGVLVRQQV